MDLFANAFGLAGVLLLARPALYAAKYGRLATRAREAGPINQDPKLVKIHEDAVRSLQEHQNNWTSSLSRCLIWGTLCSGMNNVLGLIKGIVF